MKHLLTVLVGLPFLLPTAHGQAEATSAAPPESVAVPEGINERFKDPDLDVEEWLERFEVESREVYLARNRVLQVCNIQPGESIADIGAGTGFYSRLFAKQTGPSGWAYSVDIAPRFLAHIAEQATANEIENLTPVLATDHSVRLPRQSIDMAFICDTYHHFEHPTDTLATLYTALRPGGRLIVIDFERIPGESREWILGHVRAGKATFRKEIEAAGFQFVDEVDIGAFEENYLLRFRKPGGSR